jgi:hypothetical protein
MFGTKIRVLRMKRGKTTQPSRLLLGFKLIHQIEEIIHRGYFIVGARLVAVKLGSPNAACHWFWSKNQRSPCVLL